MAPAYVSIAKYGKGRSDFLFWGNAKFSLTLVVVSTVLWIACERLQYHVVTFLCYCLMMGMTFLFTWSNMPFMLRRSQTGIPEVFISEDSVKTIAVSIVREINKAMKFLVNVAYGKSVKKFSAIIAALSIVSIVGSRWSFLSLLFLVVIARHIVLAFCQYFDINRMVRPSVYAILDEELYQCKLCKHGKSYKEKHLKNHVRQIHKIHHFCLICFDTFQKDKQLKAPKGVHDTIKTWKCCVKSCTSSFFDEFNKLEHEKEYHGLHPHLEDSEDEP